MKKSELLNASEEQVILKYESATGKACFVEFLMRYLVDEFMTIQKIPLLKGTIKSGTGAIKPFIIRNAWDKNCKLEEIQEQIIDTFRLPEKDKKNLILSREVRNKLFHGDFFGLATLLGLNLKREDLTSTGQLNTDDRMKCLMALDKAPNQYILSKCEALFNENKKMLIDLQDHPLVQKKIIYND